MWLGVAACAFVFWAAIFFVFFSAHETSLTDYLRGKKPTLPHPDGKWHIQPGTETGDVVTEERMILDGRVLVHQIRRRNTSTGNVLEVLLDERQTRKIRFGRSA